MTYTTQFGSLDNHFKPIGSQQFVKVLTVWHILEHKLFEKEDEDLFTAFAEENAQANALQALIVRVIYLAQQVILKVTLNVSSIW